MTLQEILRVKGKQVYTIISDSTLKDAVDEMIEHNVGSLLVCHVNPQVVTVEGIITERDVLRFASSRGSRLEDVYVFDAMTTTLITVSPRQTVHEAMEIMTKQRVRHLPVMNGGQLCGIISIGDLVKAHRALWHQENCHIKNYILGDAAKTGSPVRPRHNEWPWLRI